MLSKNLLIMAILFCIAFSIISSGLLSTLFDLSAFVLLGFIFITQNKSAKK
jgi:uncharacterized membrane protein YoaK (UPF0700 family)